MWPGKPIRAWDARGHAFRLRYDLARRPTHRYVSTDGAAEILLDAAIYGEGLPAANLCGRLFRHYDSAGCQGTRVRLQGQPAARRPPARGGVPPARSTGRRSPTSPTAAALDAAALRRRAGADRRRRSGQVRAQHALRRAEPAVQTVTPHSADDEAERRSGPATTRPGCSSQVDVWLQQAAAPAAPARPGHRRPARGHRHRLQRPRPARRDRLRQRHRHDLRLRPADVPARPASHDAARLASPPAQQTRPGPDVLLRPGRQHHAASATTPTPRT